MKKNILLLLAFLTCTNLALAQLTNNGATIIVQAGATLHVEGDIDNEAGSTITNNGTIEVEGDFTNDGTVTSTTGSVITFQGATDADFKAGTGNYTIIENAKTAGDVVLTDNVNIDEAVDFSGTSNIKLGNNNLTLALNATSNGSAATGYYETNGTGLLEINENGSTTTLFQVGDATDYTPLSLAHTGTNYASAIVAAKVNPVVHSSKPADAESFLTRYWTVTNTGVTDFEGTMQGTYVAGDVNGTESLMKGASYDMTNWDYSEATNGANLVEGETTLANVDFTGTNFFGRANLKVFLQGPYNPATQLMKTNLRSFFNGVSTVNLIPTISPYDATVIAGSIPVNAVDWIELVAIDGSSTEYKTSGFLLEDGSMVDIDGVSALKIKNGPSSSVITVNHRNHLSIRTLNTYNLEIGSLLDLSNIANVYNDGAISNPPQKDLGASKMAMWSGDTNGDDKVFYVGGLSDKTLVLLKVGFTTLSNVVQGYNVEDVNLDGNTAYVGGLSDTTPILLNVGFTTQSSSLTAHK